MIPFSWPEDNEVHVHCLPLTAGAVHYLSSDEVLRADRLLDPDKRNSFMAGRGMLREILGGYLGVQPDELHFAVGEHGKPHLSNNKQLHFNLSHSGALFILTVASDREVGIDIEQLRNDTPFPDMARLAFSSCEQKELFALPVHQQRSTFYRCWTRKEAYLKACGRGFTLRSNSFDINLLQETPAVLISPDDLTKWTLEDVTVPEGYCAALAVKGLTPLIRYIQSVLSQ